MPTVTALARTGATRLSGHETGRHDAETLLCHALGHSRSWLFAHATDPVDDAAAAAYGALLERRLAGEPVAYLVGSQGFWTLDLAVGPATLIPRADTERLVELAVERVAPGAPATVLDLGTGSGAVALAIAAGRTAAYVTATDASVAALAVAEGNAVRNGITNVAFIAGDWFAPLAGRRFDVIVSNPPYIAAGDPHLAQGDLRFEPASALASGPDGLDDLRRIIADAARHLVPGGWLAVEHGFDQGVAVRDLFTAAGAHDVDTAHDLEGRDRVTHGRFGVAPAQAGA